MQVRETLEKARHLVESSWCRDDLAKDNRGKVSDHNGNLVIQYNKAGEEVKRDFYPAVAWSVTGALLVASGSDRYPNALYGACMCVLEPFHVAKGYRFLSWYESYQKLHRKKVVAQTTKEDILALLDEAIAAS